MNALRTILRAIRAAATWLLIALVRLYQITLSPMMGGHCRFEPSCSNYFILAVQKYGPWRGALKGVWRVCRCNPLSAGGHDPP